MKQQDDSRFMRLNRKPIRLSQGTLVKMNPWREGELLPLVVEPNVDDVDLVGWARANHGLIQEKLLMHGGLLLRGFQPPALAQFESFARTISPVLLGYIERAAPRFEVSENIFTSTEYPADQTIPLHHEMAYSHNWPTKIWFFCDEPAREGGATPITDDRKVFRLIDPAIKKKFMEKKVMYIRNYGEGVDFSWQDAFQTNDRSEVENYCKRSKAEFEWRDGDRLRTRQVRQSVVTDPRTGETLWFNHAHLFHHSSLAAAVRESLLSQFNEDELPRNAFYGDGTPIEPSVLGEIRGVYNDSAIRFSWRKGDILFLDNFLASHGRDPFVGPRRILVAMAELYTNQDI